MLRVLPAVLVLGFSIYCVLDVARSPDADVRGLPRPLWLLLVVVLPLVGGIAWLIGGRPRRSGRPGGRRGAPGPAPVRGPDDDPDFLRGLGRPTVDPGALDRRADERTGPADGREDGTDASGEDQAR